MNYEPVTIGTMKSLDIHLCDYEAEKLIVDLTLGNLQTFEVQQFLSILKNGVNVLSNFQGDKMIFRDMEYERNVACRKKNENREEE